MTNSIRALVIGIIILILGTGGQLQAAISESEPPIKAPTVAQISEAFDQIRDWAHVLDRWFTYYATSPLMQFLRSAKRLGIWLYDLYKNMAEIKSTIKSKVQSSCGFFMVKYFATEICPH